MTDAPLVGALLFRKKGQIITEFNSDAGIRCAGLSGTVAPETLHMILS